MIERNFKYPAGEATYWHPAIGLARGVRGKAGLGALTVAGLTTLNTKIDIPAVPDKRIRYWKSIKAYWSFNQVAVGEGYVQLYVDGAFYWISQLGNSVEYLIPRELDLFQPQGSKATIYFQAKNLSVGTHWLYYDYTCLEFFDDWGFGEGRGVDNPAAPLALEP